MRVVFFGSSQFSVPTLLALADNACHQLVGVAAQPDRPSGRNRRIQTGIVHETARNRNIPVITPEKIGSSEAMEVLRAWAPDAVVVASFGQYIPTRVLALPPKGVINVHPSLLPKYRGAAPMQWSIAKGETVSGVTIFRVVKEMDAGDIILQEQHPIDETETAVELSDRFSRIGATMALEALNRLEEGTAPSIPQDHEHATYAPKIARTDAAIDWTQPARVLRNRIRGFQPWPGGYFHHQGALYKVWRCGVEPGSGQPGEIVNLNGEGPLVMTAEDALRLVEIQPEGKKSMNGAAFLCGHKWSVGDILDAVDTNVRKDAE